MIEGTPLLVNMVGPTGHGHIFLSATFEADLPVTNA